MIDWLPSKIMRKDFSCDSDFLQAVENAYKDDFIRSQTFFGGKVVTRKKYPLRHNGEDASFWHLTTSGIVETERTRSLERCERIKWPKAIIENYSNISVNVWCEKETVLFYFRISEFDSNEKDYIVILKKRREYFVLWTAYPIEREHTRKQYIKRFQAHQKLKKTEGAH